MKNLPEVELTIEDFEKDGVFAISLVKNPAIQENFIALSEHKIELKVTDEEKREVVGYALIPDKRIYRKMQDKEFNIYFTGDTVKLAAELFMKRLNLNNVTSEHEKPVSGVSVIESWMTEDVKNDKINMYGIEPIKDGWAVKMKLYNDDEWSKVKAGDYSGFSIEAMFSGLEKLFKASDENDIIKQLEEVIQNNK